MDFALLVGILPQVLLDGIILGFMYALIALGYTMVYGVLEFINFAHSEIFIIGAFVGVEIMLGLQSVGLLDGLPWPVVLMLVLMAGIAASGLVAVTVERVAYRPLRGAPRLIPLISAIGIALMTLTVVWRINPVEGSVAVIPDFLTGNWFGEALVYVLLVTCMPVWIPTVFSVLILAKIVGFSESEGVGLGNGAAVIVQGILWHATPRSSARKRYNK